MQEFPADIIWFFALPQLRVGGGWWQKGKVFLMVVNLRWIREKAEESLSRVCRARCGGRKQKWLLLAKECFDLLETIATRKKYS